MLRPSRIRHSEDTGTDVQQGPVPRILFRLRPCVNLFLLSLVDTHPLVSWYNQGGGWSFGMWPRQSFARTWTLGAYTSESYLARSHKDRIPSGVFGIASLALYASAPNHDFGQMLGCPSPVFGRLTFRSIG